MSKFTYKTKDGTKTGFVTNVGEIINGLISSDVALENPNLELVDGAAAPVIAVASQQNPNLSPVTDTQTNTSGATS